MTATSVQQMVANMQAPTFVLPVSDRDAGWELFFHGYDIEQCRTFEQMQGYLAAEAHGLALLADDRFVADMHGEDYGPSIEDDYFDIRRGN